MQLLAKDGDYVTLRLPSGEMRMVRAECRATVGTIGNTDHQNVSIGKAGRKRHMGVRPQTRGTAMNPVDHPHGGGEGSTTPGRHPVTPWGVPTLGYRTRKKGKASDKYIVRGRRRKRQEAMSRSSKKGPFVEERLMTRIEAMNSSGEKRMLQHLVAHVDDLPGDGRSHDRRARRPETRPVFVTESMVGHKLGEFAPTRLYRGHAGPVRGDESKSRDETRTPTRRPEAEAEEAPSAGARPPQKAAEKRGGGRPCAEGGEGEADETREDARPMRPRRRDARGRPRREDRDEAGCRRTGDEGDAGPEAARPKRAAAEPSPPSGRREPRSPNGAGPPRAPSRSAAPRRAVVVRAQAKYVRSSARKARLVCDHIRGKSVEEARAILAHTSRAVARDWSKLLESAVANAENNHELVGEDL